jgi:hypothetical protein
MLAEAREADQLEKARIFRLFLSVQFFFIAIRLTICGGGSAPHFAANAVLNLNPAVKSLKYYYCVTSTLRYKKRSGMLEFI